MGFRNSKYMTAMSSRKNAVKSLSVAVLAGCAMFGVTSQAQAEEVTNPSYTMKDGTETDYTYTTTNGENVNYHKIELSKPLSTSTSVTWEEVSEAGENTVSVQLPQNGDSSNPEIKYYTYTYTMPDSYTTSTERVTDLSTANVDNVLFQNINSATDGGAVYNNADNSSLNIISDFIGNSVQANSYQIFGGAIYNSSSGTIASISGNFIGNYVKPIGTSTSFFDGGAIGNAGKIINISGNFIGNGIYTERAGAIYNSTSGTIVSISGNFIGNKSEDGGGGILNTGNIGNLTANFVGNSAISGDGGAIYNYQSTKVPTIESIAGDFVGNYAEQGGAIYNFGTIGDITGDFIGNYAQGVFSYGGAIVNSGHTINNIMGNFIGNYSHSNSSYSFGGAICNLVTIGDITGNFISNYARSNWSYAQGGAIYNSGTIGDITGDFIGNYVTTIYPSGYNVGGSHNAYGGAIYNGGTDYYSGNITGGVINSSFLGNYAKSETGIAYGGAIYTIDLNIISKNGYTSVISGNYVEDKYGKRQEAIRVFTPLLKSVVDYDRDLYIDTEPSGAATLSLISNTNGKIIIDDQIVGESVDFVDRKYRNVWDSSTNQSNKKQYVDENYNDIETPEAIVYTPKLNITGDGTGLVQLNNDVINMDITLDNSTLHLGARDNVLDNNNLTLNSATLSMINNQVGVSALNSLTVSGDTNINVDVDLANKSMDRFTASEYGSHSGNLNVTGMNLLSDANEPITEIMFAEQGLKDNVTNGITSQLPDDKYQTTLFTPIYKYNVNYDNREDAGYFVFTRPTTGGSTGGAPSVDKFNPAVLGSSTTATVGATATMNQAFNYAFQHSSDHMNIPYLERISMRDRNKYALSITGDATDMGRFSPLYQPSQEEASVWIKPYATFETVGLKNGPKVHNNTYGTLIGFDTEMQSIKRGWDRVFTGYIGYNGASQRYSGIDSIQNGGLIGGTVTMYKGNFFNATTVSVGANVAQNQTMYGNEDFAMLLSGIGNKTGYNFEFKEGKLILQPSMLMSYTFVNTFDYTNAAGVRIDNKPLHALQLAPGVKVIGNLKGGWQPYASVQMVWNLMGESNATANGVKLPEMSIKPYVQYGVGVQKRIKDHFTAYGQAMVQNGGRNGVSLTAGFRWALGHDNCKYKVEDKQLRGKAAKSKCHSELDSESINANKTLTPTLSQGEGAKNEILRSAQNDGGKYIDNKTSSLDVGGVMPRAAEHKKILKQMTSSQKAAHGGKYASTTRSAKAGMLRQL